MNTLVEYLKASPGHNFTIFGASVLDAAGQTLATFRNHNEAVKAAIAAHNQ
jgi:hypothetical protein